MIEDLFLIDELVNINQKIIKLCAYREGLNNNIADNIKHSLFRKYRKKEVEFKGILYIVDYFKVDVWGMGADIYICLRRKKPFTEKQLEQYNKNRWTNKKGYWLTQYYRVPLDEIDFSMQNGINLDL